MKQKNCWSLRNQQLSQPSEALGRRAGDVALGREVGVGPFREGS